MIKFILSFFKLKPFLGIVGAAVLFAGGFGLYALNLKREIGSLETQILKFKANISNLELANKELELIRIVAQTNLDAANSKIALQNEKFKSISLDNQTLKKQIKKAKAIAKARYKNLKPPNINASCEERLNLALGVIKGLGKKE